MLSIFSYVYGPSVCRPWRSVYSGPVPIFLFDCLSSWHESDEFFMYFGDQTLIQCIIGKYGLPYGCFLFHFYGGFFSCAEALKIDIIPFVYFSLYFPCPRRYIIKILLRGIYEIFLPIFSSRSFMVSQLIFKSIIHLEFILVYGVSWWSSFIFFACSCPVLPTPLLKKLS